MVSEEGAVWQIERELAGGGSEEYARHLHEDAVVVIPGQSLDKGGTIAAMDASPGWDEFEISAERADELASNVILLSYRFDGRRAENRYAAILSSIYVRVAEGSWRLRFHQQTPLARFGSEGEPPSTSTIP